MQRTYIMAVAAAICLTGCGREENTTAPGNGQMTPADDEPMANAGSEAGNAVAMLQTAKGAPAGSATVTPGPGGVSVSLRVEGMPPGQHGVHIHMIGRCDAPTFESAGAHWNPGDKEHGLENPMGQHAGDMPNLTVSADGRGTLSYTLKGASLEAIRDADGSAMVIHAAADDQKTNPSGNSGDRIACGVFGQELRETGTDDGRMR